jgi:hypothetical protein
MNATVTMYKENAHWCYTTKTDKGASGSSLCGTQTAAIARATMFLPVGTQYRLVINRKDRGVFTKEA